jgi:hypothetical protein
MKDVNRQHQNGSAPKAPQQVIAFLTYALEDVRRLSPLGAYLLEMAIAVLNDDIHENEANDNAASARTRLV